MINKGQKNKKWGLKAFLLLLFLWIMMLGTTALADTAIDLDDPDYIKRLQSEERREDEVEAITASSANANPYTGKVYTHDDTFKNYDIVMGIDVSKHNGTINWKKVKAAGIDYAIIRIGYSTLSDGKLCKDSYGLSTDYFATNVKNARAAGVKIGVYYFSQAINEKEAHAEAAFTLGLLDGLKLDYPVVFDFEEFSGYRLAKAKLSASAGNKVCEAFCSDITKAGYDAMVYVGYNASTDRKLVNAQTLGKKYPLWISRYNTILKYPYDCVMWQYTDSGKVDGISANTDCDFHYVSKKAASTAPSEPAVSEEPAIPSEPAASDNQIVKLDKVESVTASAVSSSQIAVSYKAVNGAQGYEIWRSKAYGGTYKKIATTEDVSYTDFGYKEGLECFYQVRAYATSGNQKIYGDFSEKTAGTMFYSSTCQVKVTTAANLRKYAGTEYGQVTVLSKGTVCTLEAYTRSADNVIWFRISVEVKGKTYKGYLSSRCAVLKVQKVTSLEAKSTAAKSITLSWAAQPGVTGYQIYRANAKNGSYKKVATVKGSTTWKNTGLNKYTQYYYKVRAYSKINGVTTKGAFSAVATLGTKKTSVNCKTKTSVALRKNAGTSYGKISSISKGTSMTAYYRTKDKSGKTWYYVKVKLGKKSYNGYVSASYVKKK